jgi:predicted nuclease of predicted toxin-antitoxin system
MIFLLDHDVPAEAARVLKREGHTVHRLVEQLPLTAADSEVFAHAAERGWVTVTCNRKDFLPLAASGPHAGLIVLIRRKTRQAECAHLLRLIRAAGAAGINADVNFA